MPVFDESLMPGCKASMTACRANTSKLALQGTCTHVGQIGKLPLHRAKDTLEKELLEFAFNFLAKAKRWFRERVGADRVVAVAAAERGSSPTSPLLTFRPSA